MDVVAHALWAGAGGRALARKVPIATGTLWWMIALAVAPDIVPMLPVLAYAVVIPRSLQFVLAYVTATPGLEPQLPPWVSSLTHHLHCTMHSVVILAALTSMLWLLRRRFPIVLLGWWSHELLDIPTHSADYYAVTLFYPISDRAFDGVAWTEPWFIAINYAALAAVYMWLHETGKQHPANAQPSSDSSHEQKGHSEE